MLDDDTKVLAPRPVSLHSYFIRTQRHTFFEKLAKLNETSRTSQRNPNDRGDTIQIADGWNNATGTTNFNGVGTLASFLVH
eukprot:568036-Pleurochrysis_carterae.AAC.1